MGDYDPIPTPWPLLLRRIRYQAVPVFTLVISAALASWIWNRRGGSPMAIGSVAAARIDVNCKSDGVLVDVPRKLEMFDHVSEGELIARLDNTVYQNQITKLQGEIDVMRAELEAIAPSSTSGKGPTSKPSSGRPTPNSGVVDAVLAVQSDGPAADEGDLPAIVPHSATALRIAIATREGRIHELEQRILHHDLKAPISGMIVTVHRRPGQTVLAGHPIVTIAAEKPEYIISYIRQAQPIQPTPGMVVDVRPRFGSGTIRSHVANVGPQLEKIPDQQLRDVKIPEWGLPVHVAIPPDAPLRPGDLVELIFHPGVSSGG